MDDAETQSSNNRSHIEQREAVETVNTVTESVRSVHTVALLAGEGQNGSIERACNAVLLLLVIWILGEQLHICKGSRLHLRAG